MYPVMSQILKIWAMKGHQNSVLGREVNDLAGIFFILEAQIQGLQLEAWTLNYLNQVWGNTSSLYGCLLC